MSTTTKKLAGKVAVVTGASKGIGASIAMQLGGRGGGRRRELRPARKARNGSSRRSPTDGGKAIAVQANVAKQADIERLFAESKKAFGRLDILVNNAGIYEFSPLEEVTEEHFHKQFDLNVLGLLLASQEAVKHFGPEGGSIVNISSVASTARSRTPPSTAAPRPPSMPSPARWPRNWGRGRSASTRSIPAWSRPKACMRPASPRATSASRSKPRRRSAASASRRISPRPSCSSPRTMPRGSPAKRCTSRADYAREGRPMNWIALRIDREQD